LEAALASASARNRLLTRWKLAQLERYNRTGSSALQQRTSFALKLHLARTDHLNAFTGYGEGYVMVNAVRYERSLLVLPDRPVKTWDVAGVDTLRENDLEFLGGLGVEIVLLGTGEKLRFLHPRLLQPLARACVGVEVMDTRAACRTYNILLAEGRKVAAALVL
jgi:uncharacterized protein